MRPFAIYGASDRVNLIVRFPFLQWDQTAHEPDNHHRTESVEGFGDVSVGVRWLVVNRSFGPGNRFYVGSSLTLPSARSYRMNPFSDNADSINHRHFALGNGVWGQSFDFEWWVRSEFTWVMGITGQVSFPWSESDAGFRPGKRVFVNFHGIRQAPLVRRVYPYVKLRIQAEKADRWEGKEAPNSGGLMIAGMVGFEFEISERMAAVASVDFPLWRRFEGSQLDPLTLSLSFRRMWN